MSQLPACASSAQPCSSNAHPWPQTPQMAQQPQLLTPTSFCCSTCCAGAVHVFSCAGDCPHSDSSAVPSLNHSQGAQASRARTSRVLFGRAGPAVCHMGQAQAAAQRASQAHGKEPCTAQQQLAAHARQRATACQRAAGPCSCRCQVCASAAVAASGIAAAAAAASVKVQRLRTAQAPTAAAAYAFADPAKASIAAPG